MNQKIINKLTDIIAYAALPITLPIFLWKTRNWGKKRKDEINQVKIKKYH